MNCDDFDFASNNALIGVLGMKQVAYAAAMCSQCDPDEVRTVLRKEGCIGLAIVSVALRNLTQCLNPGLKSSLAHGYASRGPIPEFDTLGLKSTSHIESLETILQKAVRAPSLWLKALWEAEEKELLPIEPIWNYTEHVEFLNNVSAVGEIVYWRNISKFDFRTHAASAIRYSSGLRNL